MQPKSFFECRRRRQHESNSSRFSHLKTNAKLPASSSWGIFAKLNFRFFFLLLRVSVLSLVWLFNCTETGRKEAANRVGQGCHPELHFSEIDLKLYGIIAGNALILALLKKDSRGFRDWVVLRKALWKNEREKDWNFSIPFTVRFPIEKSPQTGNSRSPSFRLRSFLC